MKQSVRSLLLHRLDQAGEEDGFIPLVGVGFYLLNLSLKVLIVSMSKAVLALLLFNSHSSSSPSAALDEQRAHSLPQQVAVEIFLLYPHTSTEHTSEMMLPEKEWESVCIETASTSAFLPPCGQQLD